MQNEMPSVIIDMNLPPSLAGYLREHGIDAKHWSEIGYAGATDDDVMAYAAKCSAIILTYDLDFGAILAVSGRNGPSVIQIRSGTLSQAVIEPSIIRIMQQFAPELRSGALLTVELERQRVRMLPLR